MSDIITYPAPDEGETGVDYWERIRQLGLPFPWERDKSLPPGEIQITEQWGNRVSDTMFVWACQDEDEARRVSEVTGSEIVRKMFWTSASEWEEM